MTRPTSESPPLVLVLSGRRTVEQVKAAGYRVALAASSMPWDLMLLVDMPLEVDLDDEPEVLRQIEALHRRTPIAAVVTQLEGRLPVAGRIREALGLRSGITEAAALACEDKAETSRLLHAAGVRTATWRVVNSAEEARDAYGALGPAVIVKPRDASSAAGLARCHTAEETAEAVAEILADGRESALVEEFLVGQELALFARRVGGRTEVLSVLDAEVGPAPKFVKVGGRHPSAHLDRLAELTEVTDRALAAVGLDDWVATVQIMLTDRDPAVIEINPRVPGGQTVALIAATTGYEPTLVAAEAALGRVGEPGPVPAPVGRYHGITFERAGTVSFHPDPDLGGLKTGVPVVIDLDVEPGDEVLPINHPRGGVFGRVIVCGESDEQVCADLELILSALDLRVASEDEDEDGDGAAWRASSRCC